MKNYDLIFLRHGKLDLPYKNHGEMPLDIICKLASETLNPAVDKTYTENLISKLFTEGLFDNIEVIYSSPSSRCQSTANLLKKYIEKSGGRNNINVVTIEEANEVSFDLKKIYSSKNIADFDISKINNEVFSAMINGENCEPMNDIQNRVKNIFLNILSNKNKKLVITHDFFMRVIELYIKNQGKPINIIYDDLLNTTHNGYLCGFATDFNLADISYIRNPDKL